ncbi:solute carrier family 40 member 1-like [Physella acuta]|uniref:solute carrier family 40 member 1-like n=1 Tax=Physella acuta TaxID=109671 RepID=UPI0027DD0B63|nr:solute carrier family 40 member 1-like [Physella acuta]
MWSFFMGLYLASISAESTQPSATYGLARGGAVLLCGAFIGDWVDVTPRLKAATMIMILQNVLVMACSGTILITALCGGREMLYHVYVPVVCLSVLSRLMKEGRVLVVERDWVVELCSREEHHLAVMTSSFRRIDLLTKMLAPIVTGHVMGYAGINMGCVLIIVWTSVSLGVEYYLIRRVYSLVPVLMEKKNIAGSMGLNGEKNHSLLNTDLTSLEEEDTSSRDLAQTRNGKAVPKCKCADGVTKRIFAQFLVLYRGFKTYVAYDVVFAGLALASLYLTVLGFDEITIGYATSQGLDESLLGTLMGVGAGFGIIATFTYPYIVRRVGLPYTGVMALGLQVLCLTLCVIAVWLPGSPFDLTLETNIDKNTELNSSDTRYNSSSTVYIKPIHTYINTSNVSVDYPMDILGNSTSLNVSALNAERNITRTYRTEATVSIWVMMAGVVLARFGLWTADLTITQVYGRLTLNSTGLWTADLTITQIYLDAVAPTQRGIVNGVQGSLNQLMDLVKYGLVHAAPHPHQFGLLTLVSYTFILTGWALVCLYALKAARRRKSGY